MKHGAQTLMFLSISPLQREMRGTVKGFHTGSKVFFMTWSHRHRRPFHHWITQQQLHTALAATVELPKLQAVIAFMQPPTFVVNITVCELLPAPVILTMTAHGGIMARWRCSWSPEMTHLCPVHQHPFAVLSLFVKLQVGIGLTEKVLCTEIQISF